MLLYEIIDKCNYQNNVKKKCEECNFVEFCHQDCKKCLEYVHYPEKNFEHRKYDCTHMADTYYCKYAFRYASEIVYGLKRCMYITSITSKLRVMSIGCGPCTELAAIDYMREKEKLKYSELEFYGIDISGDVWNLIWNDIKQIYGDNVRIFKENVFKFVDEILEKDWVPDLIILQYVFSDMRKKFNDEEIKKFIQKLADFINTHNEKTIYVLGNDINLSINYQGGREYFDILYEKIKGAKKKPMHFLNANKENHFEYGKEYKDNKLIFNEISEDIKINYNPFDSCASAQILIGRKKQ